MAPTQQPEHARHQYYPGGDDGRCRHRTSRRRYRARRGNILVAERLPGHGRQNQAGGFGGLVPLGKVPAAVKPVQAGATNIFGTKAPAQLTSHLPRQRPAQTPYFSDKYPEKCG